MKNIVNGEIKKDTELINIGFKQINELFKEYNWKLTVNLFSEIIYTKIISSTKKDEFIININEKNIDIFIPIKNKNILFKTEFLNYFDASEYIESHLKSYENENILD
jgi:hypothetical protein